MSTNSDAPELDCQFNTERLVVKSWDTDLNPPAARAHFVAEIAPLLEPAVVKHLPPSLQRIEGPNAADAWIAAIDADGLVHTVRSSQTSELLGLLILAPSRQGETLTIHLGYLFAIDAWSKGYATELVRGLVGWCEDQSAGMQLLGGVEKENAASAAVLRKAGFTRTTDLSSSETDMFQKIVESGRAAR